MRKKHLNGKGFTLIELLAVIVILAVIILIAMPNVLTSMERARKNTFATEVNSIIKAANFVYSDLASSGQSSGETCVPIQNLGSQKASGGTVLEGKNFLSKDLSKYSGYVYIGISTTSGSVTYKYSVSNGNYVASSPTEGTSSAEVDSGQVNSGTANGTCATLGISTPW